MNCKVVSLNDSEGFMTGISRSLNSWVQVRLDENRQEARRLILSCCIAQLEGKCDKSATQLDLSRLKLTSVPPEIGRLTGLKTLDLSNNLLPGVPSEIMRLTGLNYLFLSDNQLTRLPSEIGRLISLNVLVLSGNQLTSLPPEIGCLSCLDDLFLFNNQLTSLPVEIGCLEDLRLLLISGNYLISEDERDKLPVRVRAQGIGGQKFNVHFEKDYNELNLKKASVDEDIVIDETDIATKDSGKQPAGINFNCLHLPNEIELGIIERLKGHRQVVRLTCKSARHYSDYIDSVEHLKAMKSRKRELKRVQKHLADIAEKKPWESLRLDGNR